LPRLEREKQVLIYADENGVEPFSLWMKHLKDVAGRNRIITRLDRLAQGHYGDCVSVGEGVCELRMFFGPGYRIYFAEKDGDVVILLCGGNKSTQSQDIKHAHLYWKEYLNREKL